MRRGAASLLVGVLASASFGALGLATTAERAAADPLGQLTDYSASIQDRSFPESMAEGPDGNMWFTEESGNQIGRITPSGSVTEFPTSAHAGPQEIAAGPDGNLWFTESGDGFEGFSASQIGRITPSGAVTEFSAGITPGLNNPHWITGGPDGNVWFTEQAPLNRIGRITPSGTVTEFSAGITPNSDPLVIAAGPDGNLWFTEFNGGRIGLITPSGTVTEFSAGITANSDPVGIAAGPDGNMWFTEDNPNQIGRITPSGQVTEFPLTNTGSSNFGPELIAAGPNGNMWFTDAAGELQEISMSGQVVSASPFWTMNEHLFRGLAAGPDGDMWFTGSQTQNEGLLQTNVLGKIGTGATQSLNYAALGDSFSSGEGNPPFLPGTDTSTDTCHRSSAAYSQHVLIAGAAVPTSSFVACSGATTTELLDTGQDTEQPQVRPQVLNSATKLVTLTVGGDDIGFAPILAFCFFDQDCESRYQSVAPAGYQEWSGDPPGTGPDLVDYNIQALYQGLVTTYQTIKTDAPNAAIYVLGYPQLFADPSDDTFCDGPPGIPGFGSSLRSWLRLRTTELDHYIADAAEAAGVNYVDTSNVLAGHEVCTTQPWVNSPLASSGRLHPNAQGQQQLAATLNTALVTNGLTNPAQATPADAPGNIGPIDHIPGVNVGPTTTAAKNGVIADIAEDVLSPGQVELRIAGWVANEAVHLFLNSSTPVDLGSVNADANGVLDTDVTIPAGTSLGPHAITAQGEAADGSYQFVAAPITVANAPDPPTGTTGIPGDDQVTASWSAPATDGGSPVTGYTVTASPGGQSCSWSSGPLTCTVTGLTSGTPYTFSVVATNLVGNGSPSTSSSPITPFGVASAPAAVAAQGGDGQATVSWSAPASNGGSTITGYTVTAAPGGQTCSWATGPLSCTVDGLTDATNESFTVTATNAAGPGPGSGVSNVVTPEPWAGDLNPLTPSRIVDTRIGNGAFGPLGPGQSFDLQVAGRSGVPSSGVRAVVMNVTATDTTGSSFLTAWPTGVTRPLASNLNFTPGQTIPNLVTVGVGTGGKVSFYNFAGSTDVVGDVVGWYGDGTAQTGTRLQPVTPARILDTRNGNGAPGPLGGGQSFDLQVTGRGGVPSNGVQAVVMNVTATDTTGSSFLTAWPTGLTRPLASNLNFTPGETIPNLVTVPVGADGKVSIYNLAGSVDVVGDVVGYFSDTTVAGGSRLTAVTPSRILDTRNGTGAAIGPLGAGQALTLQVAGQGGVAANATAVVLNVTATQPTATSFLTAWPPDVTQPLASNLNFSPGESIPNLVTVKLSTTGTVNIYNFAGTVHVVADVVAYYTN